MGEARGEMEATGGASAGLKTAALGVAAAVVGIGYESAKLAINFQSQMETLATQAGVPQSQIKSLSNGVLDLAGQVGFSPTSLAEALYHVESSFASVGITGPKAMELLKTAAEGAAVGHANLVDVTNALDAAVASGIPGVQNFNQAMGTLNATVGAGDMTMQDLAEAFSTGLLASVKGYGLTITDVGAALATFGDNNIRGANAATDLRMAVQALAVPTKAGGDILQHMGIASGQLARDMQSGGLMKALEDLKTHMDAAGVSTKEQGQVLTEIFGKKAGVGAAVLYDQLDRLKSKYPELTKSANGFGESWALTQQTFSQKMKEVEATLAAVGVRIGEKLLPILSRLSDWFIKSVGWLGAHKAVLEAVGVVAGGALAVGIWSAATAVWGFTAAILANPVFMIVEGLVALGAAVVYAYNHFAWFRTIVQDIGKVFVDLWHGIQDFVKNFGSIWASATKPFVDAWNDAYKIFTDIWDDQLDFLSDVWGALVDLWNDTGGKAVTAISKAWGTVSRAVSGEWDHIYGDLRSIWNNIVQLWNDTGGKLVTSIGNSFHFITDGIIRPTWSLIKGISQEFFDGWLSIQKAFLDTVTGVFKTAWDAVYGTVKTAWDLISSGVAAGIDFITGILKAGWDVILGGVKIVWEMIKTAINTPLDAIKNSFQMFTDLVTGKWSKLWNDTKNLVTGIWNDIYGFFKSILGTITQTVSDAASNIWSGFTSAISNATTGVWNALIDVWNTIFGFFKDASTWLLQVGKDIIQGLINGVKSMGNAAVGAVKDIGSSIIGGAKDILGVFSPSRVFHDIGTNIGLGLANGITGQNGGISSAAQALARSALTGFGTPTMTVASAVAGLNGGLSIPAVGNSGFGGGIAGFGGTTFGTDASGLTVEVYMDGQKIQGAVRQQTLRYQNRNSRNNLSLSGVGS